MLKHKTFFYFSLILLVSFFLSCLHSEKKIENTANPSVSSPEELETTVKISGDTVIEIAGPSPFGEQVRLSSISTPFILVDFWASWCGPCRKAHPNLVKSYSELDTTQISFFSISLDEEILNWKKAIDKDSLVWPYHTSDLKGWESQLVSPFGIESIPSNFLLGPNRKIIAKDIEPSMLKTYLELANKK